MARRHWRLVLLAGLSGSLFSSCTHAVNTGPTASRREAPAPVAWDRSSGPSMGTPSPYGANPVLLAKQEELAPPVAQVLPPIPVAAEMPALPLPERRPANGPESIITPVVSTAVVPATAAKVVVEPPLLTAIRDYLDRRPEDGARRLQGCDPAAQDVLRWLLPATVRLTEGKPLAADAQEASGLLDQLDRVSAGLRQQTKLSIDHMCFCRRIDTFGVYEPWPADQAFRPGEPVDVYVELRNFSSRLCEPTAGQPRYVIELATTGEIRDYAGAKAGPREIKFLRLRPDESRTLRHDYFDKYTFVVPNIAPGAYTLWIEVEDLGTRPARKARGSLDFRVTNLPATGSSGERDAAQPDRGRGP